MIQFTTNNTTLQIIVRITSVNFFKQQFTAMGMRDMSVV